MQKNKFYQLPFFIVAALVVITISSFILLQKSKLVQPVRQTTSPGTTAIKYIYLYFHYHLKGHHQM